MARLRNEASLFPIGASAAPIGHVQGNKAYRYINVGGANVNSFPRHAVLILS